MHDQVASGAKSYKKGAAMPTKTAEISSKKFELGELSDEVLKRRISDGIDA